MKKLLKTLACSAVAALVGASAFAGYGWYGGAMSIGGTTTDCTAWSTDGNNPTDLGDLTDMTISSIAFNVWSDANDRGGANMYFRIWDGGASQVGTDQDLWLGASTRIAGDHDFAISWTGTEDLADAVGLTLEDGHAYYIDMWTKTYGNSGDEWYSGDNEGNYHAKLTYRAPKTYTLVEDASDLVVGADYLVVSTVDGVSSALKNEANGTRLGLEGVTIGANGKITTASDAIVWHLKCGIKGRYRVWYNAAADVYAAAPASAGDNAQLLADGTDELAQWTLDLSALPAVDIASVSYADRYLQRDGTAANAWFAAYDSAQATPSLYRADSTRVQTVTFDPNGGTYYDDMLTVKYAKGRDYWGIWMPTWEGRKFLGWYDEHGTRVRNDMVVTEDDTRTLFAHWGQTVTFDANGGTLGGRESLICDTNGVYAGFAKPTRVGYAFLGWFGENGQRVRNGDAVTADGARTLYAHWGQTVTFDANGGTLRGRESLVCDTDGEYAGFAVPTRVGYAFLGWFGEDGQRVRIGEEVTDDASRTLFAHWGQTVNFEANGGTLRGRASLICDINGVYAGFAMPTRDGYAFLGWFDENEKRVKNGEDVTGDASRTLWAHWRESAAAAPVAISGFSFASRAAPAPRSTTVTDTITAALLPATGTSYVDFSGLDKNSEGINSDAVYAGNTAKSSGAIQINNNASSGVTKKGIVTTTSGGKAKKVTVAWLSSVSDGRTLNIYGKNTPYSTAADLYVASSQGDLIGTIVKGTSTELTISDEYAYIGIRSAGSAMQLESIAITWGGDDPQPTTDPTVTLSASAEEVYAGEAVTITASAANFSVGEDDLAWEWSVNGIVDDIQDGKTFTLDTSVANTYEVKAEATDGDAITNATVSILVKPQTVTLTPSATEVEVGETVTITATAEGFSGAVTWTWAADLGSQDGATYTLTPSAAGEYVVMAEAACGGRSAEASVTITVSEHVEVTGDVLNNNDVGHTTQNYGNWTAEKASGAEYAGQSAGGSADNPSIQLRSNNSNSGIVMTKGSGRNVSSVTFEWNSASSADRVVDVYGSTSAYTSPSQLYSANTQGTFLGSVTNGQTEVTVDVAGVGEYPYVGIRSHSGALFLTSVTIEFVAATPTVTLAASATEVEVGETVTITASATGFSDNDNVKWVWFVGNTQQAETGATLSLNGLAQGEHEVTAWGYLGDDFDTATEMDDDSVTIKVNEATTKYAITIDPDILQYATVTTTPAGEAAENANVTVNVTPNAGYVLDVIKVNGTGITGNTFNMPAATVTISATFSEVPTYTLVADASDLVVGADYLVVASGTGFTNAMKNELVGSSTKRLSVEDVTIGANGKIATASDAIVWQLKCGIKGRYRVWYNAAANAYAAAPAKSTDSAAQLLADGTAELAQWTLDLTDMTALKIASVSYTTRYLQRNGTAGNPYFASYAAGQAYPRLYRADSTRVQTVTFDPNGGTYYDDMLTVKYAKGRDYWGIWMPTWEGRKFLGWYDEHGTRVRNDMVVTEDDTRTLFAHWGQTVTFDANGGTLGGRESLICDTNGVYAGFAKPTRVGYAFLGWFGENGQRVRNGDAVTADGARTLYAHWGQTVTFDANGGTLRGRESLVCDTDGEYAGFAVPTRVGYAFLGWFGEDGQRVRIGEEVTDDDARTLYAHWGQTVSFEANGGTLRGRASLICDINGVYAGFAVPTRDGYAFLGWFDENEKRVKNGEDVTADATRTLYAHWRENAAPLAISSFSLASRSAPAARDARNGGDQVFNLRFETVAGFVYEVQWTSALDGDWTVLKRWTAEDGVSEVTVTVPDSPTGFLRLAMFDEVE